MYFNANKEKKYYQNRNRIFIATEIIRAAIKKKETSSLSFEHEGKHGKFSKIDLKQ